MNSILIPGQRKYRYKAGILTRIVSSSVSLIRTHNIVWCMVEEGGSGDEAGHKNS